MSAGDQIERQQRAEHRQPRRPGAIGAERSRQLRDIDREQSDPDELHRAGNEHAGDQVRAGDRDDHAHQPQEQRAVRRGGVPPERRHGRHHVLLVQAGERSRRSVVRVVAEVQDRALGDVAVHVTAEQGRRERERRQPDGSDRHQPAGPLAARAPAKPDPARDEQRRPREHRGHRDAAATGEARREPPAVVRDRRRCREGRQQ